MNLKERTAKLLEKLSGLCNNTPEITLDDSNITIVSKSFTFDQKAYYDYDSVRNLPQTDFCKISDDKISENSSFYYYIFYPKDVKKSKRCILIFHGLNERTWDKYVNWAEYLAINTNRPVILFPMAYHINRSPFNWFQGRAALPWTIKRRILFPQAKKATFFNMALSSRITISPERFYISGRESVYNINQLANDIRSGSMDIFAPECTIDFFSYSIGALLSEVILISDKMKSNESLFSDSRVFMFCGGNLFENMDGKAKEILDEKAFASLKDYYLTEFIKREPADEIEKAFQIMLSESKYTKERIEFFDSMRDKLHIIMLKQDYVIPYKGIDKTIGQHNMDLVELMDFPYEYSHQKLFLVNNKNDADLVYNNFKMVFDKAVNFYKE
ncbi:MAG: DUF6051 family protein [Bacteroidales bacterium]